MSKRTVLICTHGKFGEEIIESAKLIIGPMENVYCFSLLAGMTPGDYMEMLEDRLKKVTEEVICLVDLYGGTPSNTVAGLSQRYNINVVSGLNLAMLIEVYVQKDILTMEQLIDTALSAAKDSAKDVIMTIKGKR